MPYADPEKQKAANAAAMRKLRARNKAYREAENKRRNEELKADPVTNRAAAARYRARKKAVALFQES